MAVAPTATAALNAGELDVAIGSTEWVASWSVPSMNWTLLQLGNRTTTTEHAAVGTLRQSFYPIGNRSI